MVDYLILLVARGFFATKPKQRKKRSNDFKILVNKKKDALAEELAQFPVNPDGSRPLVRVRRPTRMLECTIHTLSTTPPDTIWVRWERIPLDVRT